MLLAPCTRSWLAMESGGERRAAASMASRTALPVTTSVEMFVRKMAPLIELEKEAEIASAAQCFAKGSKSESAISKLKCVSVEAGVLGKSLLQLEAASGDLLPSHKLTPHDVVMLKASKSQPGAPLLGQGVVYRVKEKSISIVVDDVPDDGLSSTIRLEKVANDVTYQRLKNTLADLNKVREGPAAELVSMAFGSTAPGFCQSAASFDLFNRNLDDSQISAVNLALRSKDLMLLHGPPGTGKTTAVVEIILQEVKRGTRVLVCAASNVAVDNIVERLACHNVKIVRMGHPARLMPQILDNALDSLIMKGDNSALAKDIRKEISVLNRKILKEKDRRQRGELRKDLRQLTKEERKRQQKAVTDVIQGASVVLSTLTGSLTSQLHNVEFDLVVIDEAAQALEVACWMALLKGRRCILAGDHLQLPPTVQSQQAEKEGLGRTLFERLTTLHKEHALAMLTVQYRMHRLIMEWSSTELYDGKIGAHETVANRTLYELDGVQKSPATQHTLLLVDTAGCDMNESQDETDSSYNEPEARIAIAHALKLVASGVQASDIGIITPYSAQVSVLRNMRNEEETLQDMEISTVDGFQGREKEAIIISMVRSNSRGEVGFLSDKRRMNVAITRAKRQCCLVCDSGTVSKDAFLKRLLDYFEEHGDYCYAMYYGSSDNS